MTYLPPDVKKDITENVELSEDVTETVEEDVIITEVTKKNGDCEIHPHQSSWNRKLCVGAST